MRNVQVAKAMAARSSIGVRAQVANAPTATGAKLGRRRESLWQLVQLLQYAGWGGVAARSQLSEQQSGTTPH
jgi:hypothetical protein